jgi:hypothetical protein
MPNAVKDNRPPANYTLRRLLFLACLIVLALVTVRAFSESEEERPVRRVHVTAPAAPARQTPEIARAQSAGCLTCHTSTDQPSMHASEAVVLGCADCHGGDPKVVWGGLADAKSKEYDAVRDKAHVLPRYPQSWSYPSSANPERSYALLNRESPEFIRFINPSDYRVAREACGACHLKTIQSAERSMMATGVMLWGGAGYNNGIVPFKRYILGEGYTRDGLAAIIEGAPTTPEEREKFGMLEKLYPMPRWENFQPGDIFRVFERGGRNSGNTFAETGLPNTLGQIQRLEEPGRPDIRASARGKGTGARIAVPLINIHKTRLNDPLMWFLGTNDQPGDYRSSGCSSCHVVYANDRDSRHSGPYATDGHQGFTVTRDPTIPKNQSGHPLKHAFTRSIPTSQCMVCHMHQPNMFMNTYLGYTMWDYESDAPFMWPKEQKFPTDEEIRKVNDRNPEGAAARGLWSDVEFLKNVSDLNPKLKDTQFADYHGHGWNFRGVFKRDRKGNLLDEKNRRIRNDDPQKFRKAVHLSSIHVDKGMHCSDCHFSQDNHGNGHLYGEVAQAVEIDCKDCHGTATALPNLRTSGPAAALYGMDLSVLRNPDGRKRFEWVGDKLIQRSLVTPGLQWEVKLVKNTVTPGHPDYNPKAARAKLMSKDTRSQSWGAEVPVNQLAHSDDSMECYTCHTSWTTSCGGCHLPIEANWKTQRHHYEGGETRNFATYNPQVARDEIFMIGRRGPTEGFKYAPVRSSSALVLSSTNANRERIYVQQPPIAASGFSSQAKAPHYPHTERKTETKTCSDCHLSRTGDNNAIVAQTLGFGTQFINFIGFHAYVGTEDAIAAVQVTEWPEPQAVIGSYLHKYAYPKWYADHQQREKKLENAHLQSSGNASCVQLRGEYLFAAEGSKGMRVYDVASVGNKGVSQKIISAPFSPIGQDTHIPSKNATCVMLPTTQPVAPARNEGDLMRKVNLEQPFSPIYNYALITDSEEGLILTDINTLTDGEFRNNFFTRTTTWNPNGVLNGARHLAIGGNYVYIVTPDKLVIADLIDPLNPKLASQIPLRDGRAVAQQFRYVFVVDESGLRVVDVTNPYEPRMLPKAQVPLADGHKVFVSRTYAYVADGAEGLAIIDIEKPQQPKLYTLWNGNGALEDARDVVVASTNASLFAYVADGRAGLKVLQLTSPDSQPNFYGFSPEPKPELVSRYVTQAPALSLSRPLERDRAVDETGGQVAVFGRRGSRPLNWAELREMYLDKNGRPWFVDDTAVE